MAQDLACGLPLVTCGDSFTPAKRLKFDSGPRLQTFSETETFPELASNCGLSPGLLHSAAAQACFSIGLHRPSVRGQP